MYKNSNFLVRDHAQNKVGFLDVSMMCLTKFVCRQAASNNSSVVIN